MNEVRQVSLGGALKGVGVAMVSKYDTLKAKLTPVELSPEEQEAKLQEILRKTKVSKRKRQLKNDVNTARGYQFIQTGIYGPVSNVLAVTKGVALSAIGMSLTKKTTEAEASAPGPDSDLPSSTPKVEKTGSFLDRFRT